jgi:hypothetical protein
MILLDDTLQVLGWESERLALRPQSDARQARGCGGVNRPGLRNWTTSALLDVLTLAG